MTTEQLSVHGNTLRVLWNDGTSSGELRLANGGQNIETFEFADGTTVSAISYNATYSQTILTGTSGNDYIEGGVGDDVINGGVGNDVLDAGAGLLFQYLAGYTGDDTYVYSKASRSVYVSASAETSTSGTADKVRLTDLTLNDITVGYHDYTTTSPSEGNALRLLWNDGTSSGELRLANGGQNIETFEFADGTTVSAISYSATTGDTNLFGTSGNDLINGGSGDDNLYGAAGDDILNSGSGAGWQYLFGQAGNDTYVYSKESRFVMLQGSAESATTGTADKIVFSDLNLANVTFSYYDYGTASAHGNALRLLWNDGTSSGELRLANGGQNIETFEFADGTTVSAISYNATYSQTILTGTSGNDYIKGGVGDDVINGGVGNDVLDAGAGLLFQYLAGYTGDDTYVYSKASRSVYVSASAETSTSGTADRVRLTDLTLNDITVGYHDYTTTSPSEGYALRVLWNDGTSSGELRLANGGQNIETFEFADGTTVSAISYNATYSQTILTGTSGNDYIKGGVGDDVINGGVGNDVLDAGAGLLFQYLAGYTGNDTYVYSKASRSVYVSASAETSTSGTADRVRLTDLTLNDITVGYHDYTTTSPSEGNALRLLWNDGTSSGELRLANGGQNIETFEFADGTTVSRISFDIVSGGTTLEGTVGGDLVNAGIGNDIIFGDYGNDTLDGGDGNDNLRGGVGADVLNGGAGTDFASYYFDAAMSVALDGSLNASGAAAGDTFWSIENLSGSNIGNDTLSGDAGANQLNGNGGDDTLYGRDGDDTLKGGLGNDTMTGGGGADKFYFDTNLNSLTNKDTITGLSSIDKLVLDLDIFTAIGSSFTSDEFRSIDTGTSFSSVDSTDKIIYMKSTGQLFYDADGSDLAYTRVLFAELPANTVVSFDHFLLAG